MKITLVDDHPLLIEAIRNTLLIQPGVVQVNTYTSADSFLSDKVATLPDMVITDLMMPGTNGLSFIDILRKNHHKNLKIIVLSSTTDAHTIRKLMKAGINGYLSKSSSLEEVIAAIHEVYNGKQYVSKNLVENMLDALFIAEPANYQLSNRENEVLQKVCNGLTLREIAEELNLSINTIKYYHQAVLAKLNVKRTADLIVFAMQHGLYIPASKPKN